MFHEYLHSLPENVSLWRNGTATERGLPHPERPWEKPVIRMEGIFRERYGQQIFSAMR